MADLTSVQGIYINQSTKNPPVPVVANLDNSPLYHNSPRLPAGRLLEADKISHDTISIHSCTPVPGYIDRGRNTPSEGSPRSVRKRVMKKGEKGLYYHQLNYEVEQVPPWPVCICLGFQHYLIMFGATVSIPMVLMDPLCVAREDTEVRSQIIGTIFVVAGISTMLQCTLGTRLPIVQGGAFAFVTPIIALLNFPKWKCVPKDVAGASSLNVTMATNYTGTGEAQWMSRMREVQGGIMVASVFQMVIGFSGVIGLMLRYIGPLSITPTIALIGFALFDVAAAKSQGQWWITLTTMVLIAIFSQYTKNVKMPCISFKKGFGFKTQPFPVARLFPVILAIGITWMICAILTAAGVFEEANKGGVSNQLGVLEHAAWFRVPYPGQWGMPTVSTAGVFGLLAGVLATIAESIGDYYACARMARVPPPPPHAINRGVGVQGIATFLAGAFGTGTGTTSYSENIGAIGITKVGSRRVVQCSALFMIVFGVFSKFGAVFATIPEPIVGGVFIVMFGMIVAVGLSNLQFVDLNSSRNLFIIGFTFFFGITLPGYLKKNPTAIRTGSAVVDQILTVLLQTNMFVGGLSGFFLDNTIPGTDEERGIVKWNTPTPTRGTAVGPDLGLQCYEIPRLTAYLKKYLWTRHVPFLPTYQPVKRFKCCNKWRWRRTRMDTPEIRLQECAS